MKVGLLLLRGCIPFVACLSQTGRVLLRSHLGETTLGHAWTECGEIKKIVSENCVRSNNQIGSLVRQSHVSGIQTNFVFRQPSVIRVQFFVWVKPLRNSNSNIPDNIKSCKP